MHACVCKHNSNTVYFLPYGESFYPRTGKKTYTVSFDANGGSPTPPAQTVESLGKAIKPKDPSRDGLTFAGWYTMDGKEFDFDRLILEDFKLTARWWAKVTLNANGGIFTDSSEEKTIDVFSGFLIEAPAVTKTVSGEQLNLAGWSQNKEANPLTDKLFDLDAGTETSITLYAIWTRALVVSFNTDGGSPTPKSQFVEKNEKAYKPSSSITKSGYVFRFWSADGNNEYDFDTPVTTNLELTALYKLNITNVSVKRDIREIEVTIASSLKAPKDGELWFTYSVDGENQEPLTATFQKFNNNRASYIFEPFVDSSKDKSLNIEITAHSFETIRTDTFTYPKLIPVQNHTLWEGDQELIFSWDDTEYTKSYRLVCSKLNINETTIEPWYRKIGLNNGEEYSFDVYRTDKNDTESDPVKITGTPNIKKKQSDWLFLMYLDGDNNLHDDLWVDLNEMEQGLGNNNNGVSINVVVLWDGWTGDGTNTPLHGSAHTRIYELGTDTTIWSRDPNTTLENTTFDYTHTADWIVNNEVDMSSQETLKNFLTWVQAHYTAENIVLNFSNHGGGPRNAPLKLTMPDGRKVDMPSGRAMCWDESNGGENFLSTSAVSDALDNVGFKDSNKLSMIMLDVCLGGAVEEAYQYRNNAEYFIASPNNIPSPGFDYCTLIRKITTTSTPESVGSQLVKDYYNDYKLTNNDWNYLMGQYNTTEDFIDAYFKGFTLTCVDLSKMETVKTAIDALAGCILSTEGKDFWKDENGSATADTRSEFIKTILFKYNITPGAVMSYMGTYTHLYDIGFAANFIKAIFDSDGKTTGPQFVPLQI